MLQAYIWEGDQSGGGERADGSIAAGPAETKQCCHFGTQQCARLLVPEGLAFHSVKR